MINRGRSSKLIYFLFLFALYSVYINAQDKRENLDIINVNIHDTSDSNLQNFKFLDKFHLSFLKGIISDRNSESDDQEEKKDQPTNAQKYGYGFLAVVLVSSFALLGALIYPLTKKPYYKYINAFFTSLAVGALFGNTAFELLPAIIQYEGEGPSHVNETKSNETDIHTEDPHVPVYLWRLLILVITAYVFYVLEMMINVFIEYRTRKTEDRYNLDGTHDSSDIDSILPTSTRSRSGTISATFPNYILDPEDKKSHAVGWIMIFGDGIHNIADGLAIGAAFSESILFGITQSVAVACQELPSELGEYMILIDSGFTLRKALLFNFISGLTAIVGFFIGVGLSDNEGTRTWIFSITSGTFIYIALVDLWPTLMVESGAIDWKRFFFVSAGYLLGVFVMFALTVISDLYVTRTKN